MQTIAVIQDFLGHSLAPSDYDTSSTSKSLVAGPLRDYQNALADVHMYSARLDELDFDHEEEIAHRAWRTDQGVLNEGTDAEHEQAFALRKAKAVEDVESASERLDTAVLQCEQHGIDVTVDSHNGHGSPGSLSSTSYPRRMNSELTLAGAGSLLAP